METMSNSYINAHLGIHVNNMRYNINKKAFITSILSGIGVGMAMMPIFNEEVKNLDEYGIDTHENTASFTISTVNTLILTSVTSAFFMYKYLTSKHEESESVISKSLLNISKFSSFLTSLIPFGMLWNVELEDQEIEGTHGFDQFVAWATFTSLPLIMYKTIHNYHNIEEYLTSKNHDNPETVGGKLSVYVISALSLLARGISLTHVLNELQSKLDVDENISLPFSIVVGGVLSNLIMGASDFDNLKKIFSVKTDNINWKKATLGFISAIEGGWFALPLVTQGLKATEDWNELAKGILFTSFFLSNMNSESHEIYNSIMPTDDLEASTPNIELLGDEN